MRSGSWLGVSSSHAPRAQTIKKDGFWDFWGYLGWQSRDYQLIFLQIISMPPDWDPYPHKFLSKILHNNSVNMTSFNIHVCPFVPNIYYTSVLKCLFQRICICVSVSNWQIHFNCTNYLTFYTTTSITPDGINHFNSRGYFQQSIYYQWKLIANSWFILLEFFIYFLCFLEYFTKFNHRDW